MNKGWIYCITNSIYKKYNLYKIGISSQIGLDQQIRKKLLQRYGTYFIDPEIIFLSKVSFPKKVEKIILENLIDYRNNNTEIITANFTNIINPVLIQIIKKYPYDNPSEAYIENLKIQESLTVIEDEIYNKIIFKLQKNMEKLVKLELNNNYTMKEHILSYLYIYINNNLLTFNNNIILYSLYNIILHLYLSISGSINFNIQKIGNLSNVNRKTLELININQLKNIVIKWDRNDKNIHKFLKNLSKIV
jgi:hypothetical protein